METDLNREQVVAILGIAGTLAGLLVLPPLLQELYGINAVNTAFAVIIFYAIINWLMKKNTFFNH